MTSIITADIIGSRKRSEDWLEPLKSFLERYGKSPKVWEIYRGDSFQLEVSDPATSIEAAIGLKALLKTLKLDARMAIGIGDVSHRSEKITESNGSAFVRSGELFETLKPQKITLAVATGRPSVDVQLNLLLKLLTALTDDWLPQSAEFVKLALDFPNLSQEELGKKLGIAQAAVSRRRKRANFDLVLETETFFRNTINDLKS